MITYDTNFMGPIAIWWYEKYNIDHTKESWAGGRIDVYGTDCPYGEEIGLPIMDGESWSMLTEWLSYLETEEVLTLDEIVTMFEHETSHKINWHISEKK